MSRLLVFVAFLSVAAATTTQLTLDWTGGWCSVCDPYASNTGNYACSDGGSGDWNGGLQSFMDPLPSTDVVTQVQVELVGQFGCDWEDGVATMTVSLQDTVVEQQTSAPGTCICYLCDTPVTLSSAVYAHWPLYNYHGMNALQVVVDEGLVCLQHAIVTLTHVAGNQTDGRDLTPPPANCTDFGGCGDHGVCDYSDPAFPVCDCDVHYGGQNCECYFDSYWLNVIDPPVLDVARSGFKQRDTLTLWVNNSAQFFDVDITFKNQLNNTCDYRPFEAIYWTTEYHSDPLCLNNLVMTIPWGEAYPTCVVDRAVVGSSIVFTGEMHVTNHEDLEEMRGIALVRTIVNTLAFQVIFPTNVMVSTNNDPTVYGAFRELSAVIVAGFDYSYAPHGSGVVRLISTVQAPYRLVAPFGTFSSDQALRFTTVAYDASAEQCDGTTTCVQFWDFSIIPDVTVCELDDSYHFDYTVECQPGAVAECPLSGGTTTGGLVFTLDTSYFCEQVVENIDLSASIAVFQDVALTTPRHSFVADDWGFFVSTAVSLKASIVEVLTDSIWVVDSGSDLLYDRLAGGNTASGDLVHLTVDDAFTGQPDQSFFMLQYTNYFVIPLDGSATFSIDVALTVRFLDTDPASGAPALFREERRLYRHSVKTQANENGKQTVGITTQFIVTSSSTTTSTSSAPATTLGAAVALLPAAAAAIVIFN